MKSEEKVKRTPGEKFYVYQIERETRNEGRMKGESEQSWYENMSLTYSDREDSEESLREKSLDEDVDREESVLCAFTSCLFFLLRH